MRHFLPPTHPPPPLPGGMTMRSTAATLIARCGSTPRLAPADPRTLSCTINVAVIATAADPHLHRTTPAVVEPIARLAQPPQCPSQNTGQCSGKAGIKGLHNGLSQGTAHRGLGGLDANLETLGPRFFDLSPRAYRRRCRAPRRRRINTMILCRRWRQTALLRYQETLGDPNGHRSNQSAANCSRQPTTQNRTHRQKSAGLNSHQHELNVGGGVRGVWDINRLNQLFQLARTCFRQIGGGRRRS
jgi:hypothetical protein